MLRPRKKHTVFELQQLKGKRCLTHIHVKSPEEAAAAEAAGVDLLVAASIHPSPSLAFPDLSPLLPTAFYRRRRPMDWPRPRKRFASGFAPSNWGPVRSIARRVRLSSKPWPGNDFRSSVTWAWFPVTSPGPAIAPSARRETEALELHRRMKELESAGAYAAELECVPQNLARFLCSQMRMLLMSLAWERLRHAVPLLGRYPGRLRGTAAAPCQGLPQFRGGISPLAAGADCRFRRVHCRREGGPLSRTQPPGGNG